MLRLLARYDTPWLVRSSGQASCRCTTRGFALPRSRCLLDRVAGAGQVGRGAEPCVALCGTFQIGKNSRCLYLLSPKNSSSVIHYALFGSPILACHFFTLAYEEPNTARAVVRCPRRTVEDAGGLRARTRHEDAPAKSHPLHTTHDTALLLQERECGCRLGTRQFPLLLARRSRPRPVLVRYGTGREARWGSRAAHTLREWACVST